MEAFPQRVLRRIDLVGPDRPFATLRCDMVRVDHRHGHDYLEIQVVSAGSGVHSGVRSTCQVRTGDVLVLRPGSVHAYSAINRLSAYVICLTPRFLREELGPFLDGPTMHRLLRGVSPEPDADLRPVCRLTPAGLRRTRLLLDALVSSRRHRWPITHLRQTGLLLQVLHEVALRLPEVRDESESTTEVHPVVRRAAALLEDELAGPWTVADLADATRVSEAYLTRLFKAAFGAPPIAYLARLRAERAAALLRTDMSVQQIAVAVGWDEPSYFSRRFRQHLGVSAREYRQRLADAIGPTS